MIGRQPAAFLAGVCAWLAALLPLIALVAFLAAYL